MSRRGELAGQMGAALSREPASDEPKPSARAPRVNPIRASVDFEPSLHKALKRFAVDHDAHLADVIRALTRLMLEDEDLARRVSDALGND